LLSSICYHNPVKAQILSNVRVKQIIIEDDTTVIDTNSIVSSSVIISPDSLKSHFQIDAINGLLIKSTKTPVALITISYRVYPFNFGKPYFHKNPQLIEPNELNNLAYTYSLDQKEVFQTKGLNKSGSISRGVTFGNNQNLAVNSNLNLQLSGQISDNVSIRASITDRNIPIQPEGNTQQLQDFDQVYIQVFDKYNQLTAGDFWLRKPRGYFMNYTKRVQGGGYSNTSNLKIDENNNVLMSNDVSVGAAVSKGKFARNQVQGVEGNQGPYQLKGAENESFIIILSGTERVFVDGKLLTRGQENDYTIDYNTGQVRFTPNQPITKDRRIVVEFQYSDKNFSRSLFQLSDEFKTKKMNLWLNIYAEQDNKNQPVLLDLDDNKRRFLSNVGDSINNAFFSGVQNTGYTDDRVLYKLIDTLGNDSVFVFSNNPDSAIYSLSFSEVGSGNGNYIQDDFSALGKVYKWVAPIGGAPQGNYEPIITLITPKKRQMATFGGVYKFSEQLIGEFEVAGSNNDLNTFSSFDQQNNLGYATKGRLSYNQPIKFLLDSSWTLKSKGTFETVNKNFQRIERFRTVEFQRNWNILGKEFEDDQIITDAEIGFSNNKKGNLRYSFNSFTSGNTYRGIKNRLRSELKLKKLNVFFDGSQLNSSGLENTNFLRHKSNLAYQIKFLQIGYKDEHEKNEFIISGNDSLSKNSYQFYDWEVYVGNADSSTNQLRLFYRQRTDWLAKTNKLSKAAVAENIGLNLSLIKNKNNQLKSSFSYRELFIKDTSLTIQSPDKTIITRVEYNFKLLKGAIRSNSFYEIGSGLELRREFVYIEVNPGQGTYSWVDYNNDGIKDLNEFESNGFADQQNYIRVFTPSNNFIKTFTNQFNQSLNIRPTAFWRKTDKKLIQFLNKFSNQTAYRIDRKTNNEDLSTAYNPFVKEIADSTLLTLNSSLRNTLFFNRANPKFAVDHTYQDIRGKNLLTNGFDSRSNTFNQLKIRWNITREITFETELEQGIKKSTADYLEGRNYSIEYLSTRPKLSYQPSTSFRVSFLGEYGIKNNTIENGGQKAIIADFGGEIRYNQLNKGSLQGSFNFVNISFNDLENTPVAFEMLNALKTGQNFLWSLLYQRNLAKNMQINLNYSGRKTPENKTIHTGGVQIRAFF